MTDQSSICLSLNLSSSTSSNPVNIYIVIYPNTLLTCFRFPDVLISVAQDECKDMETIVH